MKTRLIPNNENAMKFFIIILILIPLSVGSYYLVFKQLKEEQQKEITKNAQIANLTASYLEDFIGEYKATLKNLAFSEAVKSENRQALTSIFKSFDFVFSEPSLYWVANSQGNLVAKYPDTEMDKNIQDRDFFQASMKGHIFTGGPYIGRVTGREVIVVSVPYYRGDKVAGVVGVSIPLIEMQKKMSSVKVGLNGYASLITTDGRVLSHPDIESFRATYSFTSSPIYKALNSANYETGYFDQLAPDETERKMHSYVILREAPWVVVIVQPLKELETKLHQLISKNVLVLIILTLVLGLLIHYLLLLRDMKNAEKIKNAEKLALVGELAAGIAHEIRNPLTSIKGFVQLIDEKKGPEIPSLYTETVFEELTRIDEIVGEMLILAKPAPVPINKVNITELLRDTVNLMSHQANLCQIEIKLKLESNPLFVDGISNQLKQVFINLIKNSIEAIEDKGTITIDAFKTLDTIKIRVSDTGKGIPHQLLNKIGTPFLTTKDTGTGLGLMISYRIVQNHKGNIAVQSKVGEGTSFIIEIPIPKD